MRSAFLSMASRGLRVCTLLSLFPIVFAFLPGGGFGNVFAQAPDKRISVSRKAREGNRPYSWDDLSWNWNQRGRRVPGRKSAAELRLRAYRRKMAMRAARSVDSPKQSLGEAPASLSPASSSAGWVALGPAPLTLRAIGCRITTGFRGELLRWQSIRPMARETRCFWAELMEGFGGRRTREV